MKAPDSDKTERIGVHLSGLTFSRAGFAFREQSELDYGIDALAEAIIDDEASGRLIALQIKSGESYVREITESAITFRFDQPHYEYWAQMILPVVVCVADPATDLVYWQLISLDTAQSTGKMWKVVVPRTNLVGPSTRSQLLDVATPVVPRTRYDVIAQDDISTGLVKRYRLRIVLNGEPARTEVATIARQATEDYARRAYNRDDRAANRWGDAEASFVAAFMYSSVADVDDSNPVCSSQWVSEDLGDEFRPVPLSNGVEIGDGFVIQWNPHHDALADLHAESRQSKGDYLEMVDDLTAQLEDTHGWLLSEFGGVVGGALTEAIFISRAAAQFDLIERVSEQLRSSGSPPIGCRELDLALSGFSGSLDDFVRCFTAEVFLARDSSNRQLLGRQALEAASTDVASVKIERARIK